MELVLCLVDFTPTSGIAVDQAIAIAAYQGAKIKFYHVVSGEARLSDELIRHFSSYEVRAEKKGVEADSLVGRGNLFKEVNRMADELKPDLTVVGTHGKKGIRQNLFGSNIYRMVSTINSSCLVVNDRTRPVEGGFKKVLMPVAPHSDYLLKVMQTSKLLAADGKVYIFEIRKPGLGLSESLIANTQRAKKYLADHHIDHEYLEKGTRNVKEGFSEETIAFANQSGMDLLSIMTRVSPENKSFGKTDKENALLNEFGLPVLAVKA